MRDRNAKSPVANLPGLPDTADFVERAELIARCNLRLADIVAADRGPAGADCSFGTCARFGAVDP